jgi:two-component system osmolarity sensor histidine kinase EnvZ
MRRPSPTLFRQNLVLFVALIMFGQLTTSLLFFHFSQRPRMEVFAAIAAHQLVTTKNTLSALPQSARTIYLEQMNTGGPLTISNRAPDEITAAPIGVARLVLRMLRTDLEGSSIDIDLASGQEHRLTAHWVDAGVAYYATLPELPLAAGSASVWISVSAVVGLLSLAGALLVQRHLNRPLDLLVAAARQVGRGEAPTRLAEDGPREIATLAQGFNRMVDDLRDIEQQRTLMLAGVSHDLRTPLTKMRLVLGILEGQLEPELAAQMERGVADMDRLIEQFLDFARVDSDEALVALDLGLLVHEALASSALEDTAEVTLSSAAAGPVMLTGRRQMLKRLLTNLFDNARKYGAIDPERPLLIEISASAEQVSLRLQDHGPGFDSTDQVDLIRPFVRGSSGEQVPGAGLGLAIVARIVALHNGQLRLARAAGGGALVTISLPQGINA